jgi:hypothetical protein
MSIIPVSAAQRARDELAAKIQASHAEEAAHYSARRHAAALGVARWRVRSERALQNLDHEIAAASTMPARVSARPAPKDFRLEKLEAIVRSSLGGDRKTVNKRIGHTVFVGVDPDYTPR